MNSETTSLLHYNVRLDGPLGARLDAMISRNVAAKDVDALVAPFLDKSETHGLWQTEFWGKWMHAAVPLASYSRNATLRDSIAHGVERVLASQEPDGYIGNYPDALRFGDGGDVWGIKYTMMGLMHYYDYVEGRRKKDEGSMTDFGLSDFGLRTLAAGEPPTPRHVLDACRHLCDCVIAELGPGGRRGRELWQTGNWAGLASSSILEPVIWLYNRTGEAKYLDFATDIVRGMAEPESGPRLVDLALRGISVADRDGYGNTPDDTGEYVCKHSRVKAYEMMSCCQGLLEWCEAVRNAAPGVPSGDGGRLRFSSDEIFRAVLLSAENIAQEEVTLAGGASCVEHWFHGARKQHLPYTRLQETCVTITWMRLCQKLLRMTGDPKWADFIERAFYNAYLAALRPDGSEFASYTPLAGNRWHGMHHCFMHEDCCDANGPRGFVCFVEEFFRTEGDAATLNFYASSRVDGVLPATGAKVAFEIYSLYPRTGSARIVSRCAGDFVLRLRIPGWCRKGAEVKVNGEAIPAPAGGAYCEVRRTWRPGDIVEVAFAMPVVAHVQDHNVAFTRGPVLLARDSRFNDGDLSEALYADKRYGGGIADGELRKTFAPVRVPSDDIGMVFVATLPLGAHYYNSEGGLQPSVSFCDFASAGNTWRHADSYRVWLPMERGYRE